MIEVLALELIHPLQLLLCLLLRVGFEALLGTGTLPQSELVEGEGAVAETIEAEGLLEGALDTKKFLVGLQVRALDGVRLRRVVSRFAFFVVL